MKPIQILATATTIFILSACGSKNAEKQAAEAATPTAITLTAEQEKTAGIELGKVELMNFSSTIRANGVIDVPPQNLVSISAPLGGYLKYTKLLPGMHIKKGEVLAMLEDPAYIQLQEDYLIGKTKLTLLKAEYERQLELNRTKTGSDKAFQQAESDYQSQLIYRQSQEEKLQLIGISPATLDQKGISRTVALHSPIDGFVSKVNVNIGKYVNPSEVLFELVNPSDIHLNLKIYEKDLDKLAEGQKVKAWTHSKPDLKYDAEVILIGRDVGNEKFVEVHCHFNNYDKSLIPGMFMTGEVQLGQTQTFALPEDAVIHSGEKTFCFYRNASGAFQQLEVEAGAVNNGFISVVSDTPMQDLQFVRKNAWSVWMMMNQENEE